MDKGALEKITKKRQYKLRGILKSFKWVNTGIASVVITKGQGERRKYFAFGAFGSNAQSISLLKSGFRIKVWFNIKCNEYNEKWYTNLIVESFEYWEVNEDKIKKQKRIQELEERQTKIDFKVKSNQF